MHMFIWHKCQMVFTLPLKHNSPSWNPVYVKSALPSVYHTQYLHSLHCWSVEFRVGGVRVALLGVQIPRGNCTGSFYTGRLCNAHDNTCRETSDSRKCTPRRHYIKAWLRTKDSLHWLGMSSTGEAYDKPSKVTKDRLSQLVQQEVIDVAKLAKHVCQQSGSREVRHS